MFNQKKIKNLKNKLILRHNGKARCFNFRRREKFISNIYIYINKRYEISGVLGWGEIVPFERGLCRMNVIAKLNGHINYTKRQLVLG